MEKILWIGAFSVLLTAFVQGADAEPLGFGKIRMGMSVEDIFKKEEVICKSRGMIYKYLICSKLISIRNKPVQASFYFDSNCLAKIMLELDPVNYEAIQEELKGKWGEPSLKQVENNNITMEWEIAEGYISTSYVGEKMSGSARMMSREGIQRYEEKMKIYRNN